MDNDTARDTIARILNRTLGGALPVEMSVVEGAELFRVAANEILSSPEFTRAVEPEEDAVNRVAVGLIRSLNAADVRQSDSDDDLLWKFGSSARPLAKALVTLIRDEIASRQ